MVISYGLYGSCWPRECSQEEDCGRSAQPSQHRCQLCSSCGSCTWLQFTGPSPSLTQHSAPHLFSPGFLFRLLPLADTNFYWMHANGRLGGWWKNQPEWWSSTVEAAGPGPHCFRGSILAPVSVAPSSVCNMPVPGLPVLTSEAGGGIYILLAL